MHLREYLSRPGSMKVADLRRKMQELGSDIKDDAQIRQWIAVDESGKFKRFPSAANAQFLELATERSVKRKDMRPHDYGAIWPELKKGGKRLTPTNNPGRRATDRPAASAGKGRTAPRT